MSFALLETNNQSLQHLDSACYYLFLFCPFCLLDLLTSIVTFQEWVSLITSGFLTLCTG